MASWKKVIVSGSDASLNTLTVQSVTGSLLGTASYASAASTASYTHTASYVSIAQTASYWSGSIVSGSYTLTASYVNPLKQAVFISGSLTTTGSNSLIGNTVLSGSVYISGSTIQEGNNTLVGNTVLSGSITISGSYPVGSYISSVNIYGDTTMTGYLKFNPQTTNIDQSVSASYIYVSGSTNDLYFSQNGSGYTNTSRLRWLESNLYTGLLSGGIISASLGSTSFSISSGSAIVVTMGASTASIDPYPTTTRVSWDTITAPLINSGSAKITYVGIDGNGQIVQQTVPWGSTDPTQRDTQIELGVILHLSGSVVTGIYNAPQVSYGFAQRTDDFLRAFGPLKISGHVLQASGSTLSLTKTAGTAYNDGANYINNPNHPSTVSDPAIDVSKIYRYHMSGSTAVIDTGVGGAGYTVVDPTKYNNNGTLASVTGGKYTIQRVFWIPNSPTNAFIVYYGNATYNSVLDANNAIHTETFTEAENTAQNGILIGYLIIQTNETNLQNATIVQGGLFRSVAGIGASGTTPIISTLSGLSDVSVASRATGDLLYYNGSQWVNSKSLVGNYTITGSFSTNDGITAVTVNAASFTGSLLGSATTASFVTGSIFTNANSAATASFAQTASYVTTAVTASYIVTAQTASYWSGSIISASYASTASYANNLTSTASQAFTASFVTTARTASYVATAQTASYVVTAFTASYITTAQTASYLNNLTQTVSINGGLTVTGSTTLSGSAGATLLNANIDTLILTGSLSVTGSTNIAGAFTVLNGITGSLVGTATTASYWSGSIVSSSYAVTASYIITAQTASYVVTALTASYFNGSVTSASYSATASYANVLTSTASQAYTASYVTTAQTASYFNGSTNSASYSATASQAYTASYGISTDTIPFIIGGTAIYYNSLGSSTAGSNTIFDINTGSYTSAIFQYTAYNGSNSRAGQVIASWNDTNVQYTDFSTQDNGSTANVTSSVVLTTSNVQFKFDTGTSGWTVKSQATLV